MRKIQAIILILAAAILAGCNFPAPSGDQAGPELQTAAAQTVQAVLATPLSSATAAQGGEPAATQAAAPILTVEDNTNCRSGPGTNYAIITVLGADSSVPIVGKHPNGDFWIVDPPSATQNCWVTAEFGTVTGNTATLPEATPDAASADSGAPARPGSLFYNYSCSGNTVTTTLSWADAADNENGYRVYRFDAVIADLPPNATQFVDEVDITFGTQLQYRVEAYNSAGASTPRTAAFSCQ
jgi:hypothetical protein